MRVLFLSLEVNSNTKRDNVTYNFIVKEMLALHKRGVEVFFLSFAEKGGAIQKIPVICGKELISEGKLGRLAKNVAFFCLNFQSFGFPTSPVAVKRLLWAAYCERIVLESVRKYDIDIIHTHFFHPNGYAAVIAKRWSKTPVIATCRGAEIYNIPELDYGSMRCPLFRTAVTRSLDSVDVVTVPNVYYKQSILDMFPRIDPDRIVVLYNGVEDISVQRKKDNLHDIPTFISIGKLIPSKNYELLMNAVDLIKDKFRFRVVLVGEGKLKSKLENLIKARYREHVVLHDEMPKTKLYSMIAASDSLIHPSFIEGGANVILEALAIGVPCLVADIPAMQKEIIKEGVNGFLFDPLDPAELAEKMEYVIMNRENTWEMREACRRSVEPYRLNKKIDGYLEIYRQVTRETVPQT